MEKIQTSIEDRFAGYTASQLIEMDVRSRRIESINVDNITEEEALYDSNHSGALAESILLEKGQLSPITVRAREVGGGIVYDIIDGFHRRQGIKTIKEEWRSEGPLVQKVFKEITWDNPVITQLIKGEILTLEHVLNISKKFKGNKEIQSYSFNNGQNKTTLNKDEVSEILDWYKPGSEGRVEAVVLYGISDEKMFDLRVLAASSVQKIKFARMATWMTRSFESTEWTNSEINMMIESNSLSLAQVFVLAQTDSSGKILGISPEAVNELKGWAKKKASEWNKPLSSLALEMRTVENAAPDLVAMVTKGGGGRKGRRGVLTHSKLKAIVDELPGQWDVQRKLVKTILDHNFVTEKVRFLSWVLKEALLLNDIETIDRVYNDPQFYYQDLQDRKKRLLYKKEEQVRENEADIKELRETRDYLKSLSTKKHQDKKLTNTTEVVGSTQQIKYSFKKVVARQSRIIRELNSLGKTSLLNNKTTISTLEGEFEFDLESKSINLNNEKVISLSEKEAIVLDIFTTYHNIHLNSFIISAISDSQIDIRKAKRLIDNLKLRLGEESDELSHQLVYKTNKRVGWWIWQENLNQTDY